MSKKDLLLTLLKESVDKFYVEQNRLFSNNGMERTCVGHIYSYMQNFINIDDRFICFRELHLDSEYNKNGYWKKIMYGFPDGTQPDIILHQHPNNDKNTMVLEFKYNNKKVQNDKAKLIGFTYPIQNDNYPYKYFLGVLIELNTDKPQYTYFQNGQEKLETELTD